ncbi:hypothetical protein P700755_003535 [Psychroflexus torquis ATCC 700755]|uniref:Uncharacterized protein n=1 Tax=Psychroflexus torquis (strain ATCC 700755 / CIP 106069 / ACAM 623) TaxID=313595 RepID=K4IK13_PSYTT|nr:hypothetical protein [Psychroflexus torquis]AFU70148.1 hypothetical protein P700755_003535 [Psychroflexus torquis ATCC 700755]
MTIEQARIKYKPKKIKYLLISETPPKSNSNRFFYFENVKEQDSLFLETMKVIYPESVLGITTKEIRSIKKTFLEKFKNDGFYLIDSLNEPFEEKYSSPKKIKLIKEGQENLLKRITKLLTSETIIVLISATVFRANFEFLKENNINISNSELIDFPGSGGQNKYREKLKKAITLYIANRAIKV